MKIAIITLLSLIVVALVYLFLLVFPGFGGKKKFDKSLLVNYAHRGLHDKFTPENSLAAFAKAAEAGYGIELDVQLSRDGKVMVFHDYALKRMTGDERMLKELTADELRALRLNSTEEKIPYLSEVLELIDGRIPILVELKGESTDTSLCPKVNEVLSSYNGAYCVESFNPMLLSWYRRNRPDIARGILTTKVCKAKGFSVLNYLLDTMMLNVLSRPDFIAYDQSFKKLSVRICTKLFGAPAFVWTVRRPEDYAKLENGECAIFEGFRPDAKSN